MKLLSFLSFFLLLSCTNRFVIDTDLAGKLSSIKIEPAGESIARYEFENHLRNLLDTKQSSIKYRLEVTLIRNSSSLVIQKDADSARESVELMVNYHLYDALIGDLLYSGKFRQLASYNTLFSPFSTNVEQVKTDSNLAKASAEELRRRLILYFKMKSLAK